VEEENDEVEEDKVVEEEEEEEEEENEEEEEVEESEEPQRERKKINLKNGKGKARPVSKKQAALLGQRPIFKAMSDSSDKIKSKKSFMYALTSRKQEAGASIEAEVPEEGNDREPSTRNIPEDTPPDVMTFTTVSDMMAADKEDNKQKINSQDSDANQKRKKNEKEEKNQNKNPAENPFAVFTFGRQKESKQVRCSDVTRELLEEDDEIEPHTTTATTTTIAGISEKPKPVTALTIRRATGRPGSSERTASSRVNEESRVDRAEKAAAEAPQTQPE